jgi:hypothetical protein
MGLTGDSTNMNTSFEENCTIFNISTNDNMLSSSVTDIFETKPIKERFAPDTPEWIVERLKDSPLPRAVGIL